MTLSNARTGYGAARKSVSTPRAIEAAVLLQITNALSTAEKQRDNNFPQFVSALHDNLDVWRIFASELASEQNGLPVELRQQLFSLAAFVHDETRRILDGRGDVGALCDINLAISGGMSVGPVQDAVA